MAERECFGHASRSQHEDAIARLLWEPPGQASLLPEVREAMLPFLGEEYGNPSAGEPLVPPLPEGW